MLIELFNIWDKFQKTPNLLFVTGEDISINSGVPYFPEESSIIKKTIYEIEKTQENPFLLEDKIKKRVLQQLSRFDSFSDEVSRNNLYSPKEIAGDDFGVIVNKKREYNTYESIGFWGLDSYLKYLNYETFIHNPPLLWEWIFDKREKLLFLEPNDIHYNLLKLEEEFKQKMFLLSSSIDGLYYKTGIKNIMEINGNILNNKIVNPAEYELIKNQSAIIFKDNQNRLIRPNLLLSGETLDITEVINLKLLKNRCDIIIVLGGGKDLDSLWKYIETVRKTKEVFIIEFNEYESHAIADCYINLPLDKAMETFSSVISDLQRHHIRKYGQ